MLASYMNKSKEEILDNYKSTKLTKITTIHSLVDQFAIAKGQLPKGEKEGQIMLIDKSVPATSGLLHKRG